MALLKSHIEINPSEIEIKATRSGGPGGQHVNKTSTAIHLRFDIRASSLDDVYKQRLLKYKDQRITTDGIINIKVQDERSQLQNKVLAIKRLNKLINSACAVPRKRKATYPSKASGIKRLESKAHRAKIKTMRKKVDPGRD